jgi:hypothetical protein
MRRIAFAFAAGVVGSVRPRGRARAKARHGTAVTSDDDGLEWETGFGQASARKVFCAGKNSKF